MAKPQPIKKSELELRAERMKSAAAARIEVIEQFRAGDDAATMGNLAAEIQRLRMVMGQMIEALAQARDGRSITFIRAHPVEPPLANGS